MSNRARVALLTITIILTLFTFTLMYLTRPGHSELASKVLESAAARQSQPLATVNEPLETDLKTLSEEEKMAKSVAEILKADEDFNGYVAERAKSIADEELAAWKEQLKAEVLSSVDSRMSSYSLDVYIPELKAEIEASIDAGFSSLSLDLDAKLDNNLVLANQYTDESVVNASAEARTYVDNSVSESIKTSEAYTDDKQVVIDTEEIARKIVESIGVSDEPEYEEAVKRIVSDVIESAFSDARMQQVASDFVEYKHNSLMESYIPQPAAVAAAEEPVAEAIAEEPVAEAIAEEPVAEEPVAEEPVAEEPVAEAIAEEPVAEEEIPAVTEVKKPMSVPSFSTDGPVRQLSSQEYRNERDAMRREQISSFSQWL